MNAAWIVGTVIAALGAFAAVAEVWRTRNNRRANLTLKRAELTQDGALRVSVANAGDGPALHAEIAVRETAEGANQAAAWLEFIRANEELTADLVLSDDLLGDTSAVFHLSWDNTNGGRKEKISKRGVRAALLASQSLGSELPAPNPGSAFVYDRSENRVLVGSHHHEILYQADLLHREDLVCGYVLSTGEIEFYDWQVAISGPERQRIVGLVKARL